LKAEEFSLEFDALKKTIKEKLDEKYEACDGVVEDIRQECY
jgi:hypothetical protein